MLRDGYEQRRAAAGFVITFENGWTVYFAGSSAATQNMALWGEAYNPDAMIFLMHPAGEPRDIGMAVKLVASGNPNLKALLPRRRCSSGSVLSPRSGRNPLFMRMTPAGGFEIALLVLQSLLAGSMRACRSERAASGRQARARSSAFSESPALSATRSSCAAGRQHAAARVLRTRAPLRRVRWRRASCGSGRIEAGASELLSAAGAANVSSHCVIRMPMIPSRIINVRRGVSAWRI
jgi:hypothetical protein